MRLIAVAVTLAFALVGCANQAPLGRNAAVNLTNWSAKADVWILDRQDSNGLFPYFYSPVSDASIGNQHALGQLIAGYRLATLAQTRPALTSAHQNQFQALNNQWLQEHPLGQIIDFKGDRSLGAQALYLRALIASPVRTEQRAGNVKHFARLIRDAWRRAEGFPEAIDSTQVSSRFLQRFYTPQAALALLEHHQATGNIESLDIAMLALDWLERTYPSGDDRHFHPSQVPWLAESLVLLNKVRPGSDAVQTLFTLTDELLSIQDRRDFPGRFWQEKGTNYGRPNIVRDAQSTRVLLMALEHALDLDDKKRAQRYQRAAASALENLRAHQYDVGGVEAFPNPGNAVGALRFRYNDALIRLDGVVFSAMVFEHAAKLAWQGKL